MAETKNTTKPKAPVYTTDGGQSKEITLPEAVFGVRWNGDLVHQVATGLQANRRMSLAHAKDRSEVSGGGRKPWRQKGTGRARHGSTRSPIWRGGGATFGPRNERNYEKHINRKMRTKALFTALSQKLRDGEVLFLDTLSFSEPKTAKAREMFQALARATDKEALGTRRANRAYIAVSESTPAVRKSFQNFGNVKVEEVRNMNVLDVLSYKYVIITNPESAIAVLSQKGRSAETDKVTEA